MTLDETITLAFGPRLEESDFDQITARKWVRGTKAPIREIFQVQAIGARYSTIWGFGLDFVPLYRQESFRWKRTNKSCDFDLCIDPIDERGDVPEWCSFVHLPSEVATLSDVMTIASIVIPRAHLDFDAVDSLSDLTKLFEQRSRLRYRRFSYDNYVQVYLAWGLLLCVQGASAAGEEHLRRFCSRFNVDRKDPSIEKAIQFGKCSVNNVLRSSN